MNTSDRDATENANGAAADKDAENLRHAYDQLCQSYRAIDEFRGKLLQLLPLGTGIFLVLPQLLGGENGKWDFTRMLSPSIGLFGIAVALGLFALELFGIKKCAYLIEVGKQIERKMHAHGQFEHRPHAFFGYISEPFAAGVIYPAVIAAWAFVGFRAIEPLQWIGWPIVIFVVLFLGSLAFIKWLHDIEMPRTALELESAEAMKGELFVLIRQMTAAEQKGEDGGPFFQTLLSDQLIFRRAGGKVVGKLGDDGFIAGLKNNPFSKRETVNVSVSLFDDRALATLVVVGTRKDDGSVHRYRNVRLFSRAVDRWKLECWYNYEIDKPAT